MQTFLPYKDFNHSAAVLDRQRLGKQRVEVLQILRTLSGKSAGWSNHPAVRMWRGNEGALIVYGVIICNEWTKRGYKDSCKFKIEDLYSDAEGTEYPIWLGNYDFHRSHQSNLVRKNPEYYGPIFPNVPNDIPYIWPK